MLYEIWVKDNTKKYVYFGTCRKETEALIYESMLIKNGIKKVKIKYLEEKDNEGQDI